MRKIQDLKNLDGKKVLVRANYNVPMKNGAVFEDDRIVASLDTIDFLISKGASVILLSHLGRPKGKTDQKYSLKPVVKVLEKLTKKSVQFEPNCIGKDRDEAIKSMMPGEILLLENTRFYPEEEKNDSSFAKKLAGKCDLFINDAFPDSHRAHASVVGVAKYLPAYAGFALQDEVYNLSKILKRPQRPFVFISGGAKISDKLKIVDNLMSKVDVILVGGGMANTFLCSQGLEIGCSFAERGLKNEAKEVLEYADKQGVAVLLPEDVIVTRKLEDKPKWQEKDIEQIETDEIIADIGSNTIREYKEIIAGAGTIFWNGPLGISEYPEFDRGTRQIGEVIASAKGFSVIGGGDTITSLPDKLKEKFDFVSMAGGASMEFLEGKSLPGLQILK